MQGGGTYVSPLVFPNASDPPFYLIGVQIVNAANIPLGILIAAFPLDEVQQIVANGSGVAGQGSYAVLLDEHHLRIAHGADETVGYKLLVPPTESQYRTMLASMRIPVVPIEEVATNLTDFDLGLQRFSVTPFFSTADTTSPGKLNSVAVTRLSSRPWLLAVLQPQAVILAPVTEQTGVTVFLAAAVAGLSVLAALVLARLLADPIVNLTSIAKRAADGDLSLQVPVTSLDEIGTLGMAFNSMISQLRLTLADLEARVAERTAELAKTSEQMRYRANRLQQVAQVAHAIAAVQDPAELLPRVTEEISLQYGYYHVGVFLKDKEEKYAVLQAANSEGGKRMLARGHRLRIGEVGLVGYVADRGEARIALDVGQDAVFFDNPDLPETRSEIALPLKVGTEVIGVLDVQSTEAGAFSQDDIALLSALADQVAMAIQNSRLFEETRRALRELQVAQRQYLQQAWRKLVSEKPASAYQYVFGAIKPVDGSSMISSQLLDESHEIFETGRLKVDNRGRLLIPIALRGQVIGQIDLQDPETDRKWSQEELELAQAVADQVGLALENARLLEETQRRAERERLVADITTKMRASNNPQAILETAVVELRNALGVKSVQVRIQSDQPGDGGGKTAPSKGIERSREKRGAA
jgi:GAF domain-containing protein/HAMP domain-containing protein